MKTTHYRIGALAVLILLLAPSATAAQANVVSYGEPDVQFPTSRGTLQGVAVDENRVYAFATSSIAAYTRDGLLLSSRSTLGDGSYGGHLGDGALVSGRIYISTSNYPTALEDRRAAIAVYDAASLAFIEELTPQGSLTGAGGGVGSKGDTLWWPFVHRDCSGCPLEQVVYEVSPDGSLLGTYPLVNEDGYFGYQTADWISDTLLLATNHGGKSHDYSDVYEWTGAGFDFVGTARHASWTSTDSSKGTEYGSQGFAVEHEGDDLFMWWVGRDAAGNGGGSGDVVRVPASINHPPQDPQDPPEDPPEEPEPDPVGDVLDFVRDERNQTLQDVRDERDRAEQDVQDERDRVEAERREAEADVERERDEAEEDVQDERDRADDERREAQADVEREVQSLRDEANETAPADMVPSVSVEPRLRVGPNHVHASLRVGVNDDSTEVGGGTE